MPTAAERASGNVADACQDAKIAILKIAAERMATDTEREEALRAIVETANCYRSEIGIGNVD